MSFALYYNSKTDNVEMFPKNEDEEFSNEQIEKLLEKQPHITKWVIYDHVPDEDDVEDFSKLLDDHSSDEDSSEEE